MSFINCHIHIFTINHVPDRFLPLRLVKILRPNFIRKPLAFILRKVRPFDDRDLLDRYMNFVEVTANRSQRQTLQRIRSYYPRHTKFVVLPMDMEFMHAGKVRHKYEKQLEKLNEIYLELPDVVFPFIAVDPRRNQVLDLVKKYIEEHNFKGIKLYPRLGFYPNDDRLKPVYEYAQEKGIPILSHCSRGGVFTKKVTDDMLDHPTRGRVNKKKAKDFSHYFTEPNNFDSVLTEFPDLKVCLAHFGGDHEWDKYLRMEWDPENPDLRNKSWVGDIIDLMKEHPNLYTDISYTAFHSERYFPLMAAFLDDTDLKERIMFGSDYYMVEREKISEREMSLKVRYALGRKKFELISGKNVKAFLGI